VKLLLRILHFTISALSLLLAISFLVIWIRSHYVEDYCEIREKSKPAVGDGKVEAHSRRITFDSTNGVLRISSADQSLGRYTTKQAEIYRESRNVSWSHLKPHAEPNKWLRTGPEGRLNRLGFCYWRGQQPGRNIMIMRVVGFPWWAPTLLFSLLPLTTLFFIFLRRRRRKINTCPTCGYDLRATPDLCPECGTPAPIVPVPIPDS